jgi:hypothetical protein
MDKKSSRAITEAPSRVPEQVVVTLLSRRGIQASHFRSARRRSTSNRILLIFKYRTS